MLIIFCNFTNRDKSTNRHISSTFTSPQVELSFKSSHLPVMGKGGHGKGAPARWPRVQTPCDVPGFCFNEKPGVVWDFLFLLRFLGEKEHCARFCHVGAGVFFVLLGG